MLNTELILQKKNLELKTVSDLFPDKDLFKHGKGVRRHQHHHLPHTRMHYNRIDRRTIPLIFATYLQRKIRGQGKLDDRSV